MIPSSSRFMLPALFVFLIAGGCTQELFPTPDEEGRPSISVVDSVTNSAQEKYDIPAAAAVIVRSDSILAYSASGVRRQGLSAQVSAHDWFHLGSNTKALTATLIALLVEQGKLSWGTTPLEVFPTLSDSIAPAFRTVTLEQLLAHRAGLQPFTDMREYRELPPLDGTPKERRAAFSTFLLQREPSYVPGSRFVYSNAGYAVAAAMAEQVSGVSFEQMMRQRLFEPLEINGGFGWPAAVDSNQPWGHRTRGGDMLQPHDPSGRYRLGPLMAPAGDVYMNMPDYGRFLQLHLCGLKGEETGLLSASTIQDIHESRGRMTERTEAPGYGLGWVVHAFRGVRSSSHAGSVGTFKARATIQASRDLAIAVVANAGNEVADEATSKMRDALLKQYGAGEKRVSKQ